MTREQVARIIADAVGIGSKTAYVPGGAVAAATAIMNLHTAELRQRGGAVMTDQCSNCRFWDREHTPESPQPPCRRYPRWERRAPGDWCGEFKAKSAAGIRAASAPRDRGEGT